MNRVIGIILVLLIFTLQAERIELTDTQQPDLFNIASSRSDNLVINFSLDHYDLETIEANGLSFQRISYEGEGEFAQPGKPDLPRFTRLIAIPDIGSAVINILNQNTQILSDIDVYPRQALEDEGRSDQQFLQDEDFYSGNEPFPVTSVTLGEPAVMRDFRVVGVTIDPFSYDPVSRELQIIENISVEITFTEQNSANPKRSERKLSRAFEPLYRSSILNYDSTITRDAEYQQPSYLFIYPEDNQVENYLASLLDWKHEKGFVVNAASTAETGTSLTQIKNYIQNAYDNWEDPPEFICMAGDANGSYYLPTGTQGGGIGDQYYARLEGDDILADVFMGRLSYNSISELTTILAKILNYEKNPYMGSTDWFDDALLVGDPSSSGVSTISTCLYIKDIMENYSDQYDFTEVYSSPFVSGIANGINSGVSYFNYRGYYNTSGWDNSDINSLSNGFMLPVVVIITCGTGDFDSSNNNALNEYFMKAGTTTTPKGAIACIGTSTLSTHTCFNNCVAAGTATGVFVDEIFNMGGALTRGKLGLYLNYPGNPGGWVYNFSYWNNLMGDPGMEVWTGVPQVMTVDFEEDVPLGTNLFSVSVTDSEGQPIENAWVTILKGDDEIFATAYSDGEGNVLLPLTEDVSGEVTLTVSKHDHLPVSTSFDITQHDQFVSTNDLVIDDDELDASSGNGDGIVNPGETIELQLSLKNRGTSLLSGITAQLESNNEFVELVEDVSGFGDLTAGSAAFGESDYVISFDSNTPGGEIVQFTLQISDDTKNSWTDRFSLIVNGPVLEFFAAEADDAGNGIFDPGETSLLNIELLNAGMADISAVSGIISTEDERITILDAQGYFPSIEVGETAFNDADNFQISVDTQTIPGSQIRLELELTNASGFQQNIPFFLAIGSVNSDDPLGPDAHGYYIYDDTDIDYSLAPVYNWYEIDPDYGGAGTILNMNDSGNEGESEVVSLPNGFRLIYYGLEYSEITICSNGWLAPGSTDNFEFMNWHIPGLQGPSPMIAPFWDDLMTSNGNICYYYEEASSRFIIEWSHLRNEYNNDTETFQVILYDTLVYPTLTGDSDILFQYNTINNVDQGEYSYGVQHGQYASVGLEDHTSTIGLEYTFNNEYPAAAVSLHDGMALLITTNQAMIVDPPIAVIDQEEISVSVMQGENGNAFFEIANEGEANLVYHIQKTYIDNEEAVYRDEGGPDEYGYIFTDSNESNGPEFNWIDISDYGTLVEFDHNDEGSDPYPMDFTFNFYGTDYTEFRINPNGWIGFGSDSEEWLNTTIPSADAPRPALFPYWDDLYPDDGENGGGHVYYYSTPESLIVMFNSVIHYPGAHNGTYDFEAIIYPDGEILYQYNSVSGDIDTCTIGIQNENGDDGLMVVYNLEYVENQLAIRFKRIIDWLTVEPSYGVIVSGDNSVIDLSMDSSELMLGHFLCDLIVTTNDPNFSEVTIPVNLYLATQEQNIYVEETELNFGDVKVDSVSVIPVTIHNFGLDSLYIIDAYSDDTAFTVDQTEYVLGYNETAELMVTFLPLNEGHYDAELSIASNDPDEQIVYVALSGTGISGTGAEDDLPDRTALLGNYPNPFNPTTTISFALNLEDAANAELIIYNIKGQRIKRFLSFDSAQDDRGLEHKVIWDGSDENGEAVTSGVYFYKLKTDNYEAARKMVLLK